MQLLHEVPIRSLANLHGDLTYWDYLTAAALIPGFVSRPLNIRLCSHGGIFPFLDSPQIFHWVTNRCSSIAFEVLYNNISDVTFFGGSRVVGGGDDLQKFGS